MHEINVNGWLVQAHLIMLVSVMLVLYSKPLFATVHIIYDDYIHCKATNAHVQKTFIVYMTMQE